ncbi:MAG: imidazole glycerol phosphate synthase subunit HisH [Opitutales bacterium]
MPSLRPDNAPAPRIGVVDYGMGNLRSVANALATIGADVAWVREPVNLRGCDGLVLPGVGALRDCVAALAAEELDVAIRDWIAADRPFLGVCLGLQALFEHSEEADARGLGVFAGSVRRFRLPPAFKVPHMGWNSIRFRAPEAASDPLRAGLAEDGDYFYFVHSYHCVPDDPSLTWCTADYNGAFCAGIRRGHCYAMQFHPEKSQAKGLRLYRNFADLCARHPATAVA